MRLSTRSVRLGLAALGALAVAVAPARSTAQGSCEVNNQNSCAFGNTASYALTVTITSAVLLETSAATVPLPTPDGNDFQAGFGSPAVLSITVHANLAWTLTIRSTQATWSASGSEARLNRPVGDLQWKKTIDPSYTDMTTSAVTLHSGAATGGTPISLQLRARYQWQLDSPGDYSLPLQLTLTAP